MSIHGVCVEVDGDDADRGWMHILPTMHPPRETNRATASELNLDFLQFRMSLDSSQKK